MKNIQTISEELVMLITLSTTQPVALIYLLTEAKKNLLPKKNILEWRHVLPLQGTSNILFTLQGYLNPFLFFTGFYILYNR